MELFIDADGCPVVDIAIDLAKKYSLPVTLVKNYAHNINSDYAKVVTVDISPDSADFYIFSKIKSGDILISQDLGLMAMVLAKGVICIDQNGGIISNENIDLILQNRHLSQKLRREQNIYSKFKKRESKSDSLFKESLIKIISENT